MNEKNSIKSIFPVFVIYYICLLAIWGMYTLLLRPVICNALGEETFISSFIRSGIIKNIVWTLPAAFLIVKFRMNCMISLKDMFTKISSGWKSYLSIFLLFAVYIFIGSLVRGAGIHMSENFDIDDIVTVLFVGLTEELVFRGWLLNSTVREDSTERQKYIAIAVNALMFLCIHFPIWVAEGKFVQNFVGFGFISILILSAIFSVVFIKTKNIILPITLHMFWDLLIFMFLE